jgi:hypothetical protein
MYTLLHSMAPRVLLVEQLPALTVSIIIAESFYKFHSFTLECIAFLVTWYVLDAAITFLGNLWREFSNRS